MIFYLPAHPGASRELVKQNRGLLIKVPACAGMSGLI